ncbi:hypothetical protein ACFSGX_02975 [Sphingomonas arantia]|uniref:Uncharacterized protein n=2 Tax=Sphingomonas arantia TaxID=1460676 RepID=A0ABW4TUV5_9SPHN
MWRLAFLTLLACAPVSADAQAASPTTALAAEPSSSEIMVTGVRSRPSQWREAETSHVRVLSDGTEAELIRIARNLETLHLLLSGLMGRGSADDDTVKLRITLIGGVADFEAMDLHNTRWQQGPFARPFMIARYYDPRDEGAVMASSRFDQTAVLQQGLNLGALTGILPGVQPGAGGAQVAGVVPLLGLADSAFGVPQPNELSVAVPATSILYSLFAQHWLMTYFPGAYPRWYLDGFGQLFSTITVRDGRIVEYGRAPENSDRVIRFYGGYPLERLFDGRYLDTSERTEWTPFHAWLITHYLFFSDDRRPQVRRYLAALGNGASQA